MPSQFKKQAPLNDIQSNRCQILRIGQVASVLEENNPLHQQSMMLIGLRFLIG